MTKVTIQNLMEAGVHYGHQKKRWNPKMKQYVYGVRNGIYIFDLTKSMVQLESACKFIFETVLNGGEILLVGTKRQAQEIIRETAEATGMHYVCERWLGGTLTNNKTIRNSITKMQNIVKMQTSGELDARPKKEASSLRRKLFKLQRDLSGIVEMRKVPQAMVIIDIKYEDIAVKEATRLNIPIVALVDTNCNPDSVDHVIPGNDDAHRAIKVIVDVISNTIKAAQEYKSSLEAEEAAAAEAEAEEKAKAEAAQAKEKTEKTETRDAPAKEANDKTSGKKSKVASAAKPKKVKKAKDDTPVTKSKSTATDDAIDPGEAADASDEATGVEKSAASDETEKDTEKEAEEK